jgi:hypothetical protein
VSVAIAVLYVLMHPEMPRAQSWAIGVGIIALFQVVPISPGSLVRGLYVVFLVIRERNFRDYNVAVFLGFFKYVGYLAFPIQMANRYPALARFMAGHWATEAVHAVPVFGERGALLEHWVFSLFYNWPLTVRRRLRSRAEGRSSVPRRHWHVFVCALAASGVLCAMEYVRRQYAGGGPGLREVAFPLATVPFLCGALVTLGAGGATLGRRVVLSVLAGVLTGVLVAGGFAAQGHYVWEAPVVPVAVVSRAVWLAFTGALAAVAGGLLTELTLPDPRVKQIARATSDAEML